MSTTQVRIRATHVFISYARANISFAHRLVADLQRSGITVWIDQSGLTPGTPDWETALRDAIGKAHAVILLASEEARKSPYVKDELRLAHEIYHLPIYPLWVEGTQWMNCIPLGWGGTQYIDARGGEARYQVALHQLIAILSGVRPVTPLSPTSTLPAQPTYAPPIRYVEPAPKRMKSRWPAVIVVLIIGLILVSCVTAGVLVVKTISRTIPGTGLTPGMTPTDFTATPIVPGKLQITPPSFTVTRTGGSTGGCDYFPNSQWVCIVHLKNIDAQNDVSYSTDTNPNTITVEPSTSNVPISPGETTSVYIMIPDMPCPAQADISFTVKGGDTTVVHWTCTG